MDIKLSQDDLQQFSEFLYSKAGMIDENDDGNLSKLFLIALYNYVGDDNSGNDVLFKGKKISHSFQRVVEEPLLGLMRKRRHHGKYTILPT